MQSSRSPFAGFFPRGHLEGFMTLPKARLQLPAQKQSKPHRGRLSRKRPPADPQRTIDLDVYPAAAPVLTPEIWATDSPYVVRGSYTHQVSLVPMPVTGRRVHCLGRAERSGVLHLALTHGGLVVEQPYRLKFKHTTGTLDALTANPCWYERNEATPWQSVTAWEIKDTSLFAATQSAKRQMDRLCRQAERGLALSAYAECAFAVLLVELPMRPQLDDITALSLRLGCDVQTVNRAREANLRYLMRYSVLLQGRDEQLMDAVLHILLDHERAMPVPDIAAAVQSTVGRVTALALHATHHRILHCNLDVPLDRTTSEFAYTPGWYDELCRLRGTTGEPNPWV